MRLSATQLRRFFDPAYFERGQGYHRRKRVIDVAASGDHRIEASVQGSGRNIYHVEIELIEDQGQLFEVEGFCSCPIGYNCKHVVAATSITRLRRW